jgi:hypothetical protein
MSAQDIMSVNDWSDGLDLARAVWSDLRQTLDSIDMLPGDSDPTLGPCLRHAKERCREAMELVASYGRSLTNRGV